MTATYSPIAVPDVNPVADMMRDFYQIDGYPFVAEFAKAGLLKMIANPELGKVWMIRSGGKTAGYIVLSFAFSFEYRGTLGILDELYIVESMRGLGIGTEAVNFVKQQAASCSVKMLYLEIEPHNAAAQKMYLASGFETHRRGLMFLKLE